MNDLMTKAGIASTCPICMQNIIDSQAEQLKKYKQMATKAIGGPVDEFKLLLSSERAARETICNLKKQLAAQAKAKEIERLRKAAHQIVEIKEWSGEMPGKYRHYTSALDERIGLLEQALKSKEGAEDESRLDNMETQA